MNIQNTAHFVMQSKGGAGKSVVSAILSQYLLEQDKDLILIDTDPSNKTLGNYAGLPVQKIEVLNSKKLVDQSKFDGFVGEFAEQSKPMLVDTGSGDFLAINAYMNDNAIPELFTELGKELIIHVPINFGQAKAETLKCLIALLGNHPNTPVVIWQNEFFGDIEETQISSLIKKYKNVVGSIKIRSMNVDTEQKDFSNMLEQSLTFSEVEESTDKDKFGFMQKVRLRKIKKELWEQLDNLFNLNQETVEKPTSKAKK